MVTRNKIYYLFKPVLPWSVRYFARRLAARRTRVKSADIWPINPKAALKPEGWPGWPGEKEFAFVITHDVEGPEGLENCRRVAELEMELGFRSSFNFIPEGSYTVPPALREWLQANGFEVGIHDLHHDGKLFDSSQGFSAKATRINYYLREWGAVGFRAGFMLRNLEWHHKLDIQYDSSTFDTDPFEPQPDGAETIFPFWIAKDPARPPGTNGAAAATPTTGRGGYVELPYTLAQDSTLYLLLREQTPEIWQSKLKWIAEFGGMALVNVHPDYIRFEGAEPKSNTYAVSLYASLLRHVKERYSSRYWQAKPSEVAAWFYTSHHVPARAILAAASGSGTSRPEPQLNAGLAGRNVAVLLYSNYPSDPRPRRAAEAMAKAGMNVELFCLSQSDDDPREEVVNGVRVFRHPMKRRRNSVWTYLWQYSRFGFSAFRFLVARGWRRKIDLVHVHNMPDFLVFAALWSKFRGARVILDLHDPSPELMMTIFGLPAGHWFVRTLRVIERWSIGLADLIFTPNITFKNLFAARSCPAEKIVIVMNSPEPSVFALDQTVPDPIEASGSDAEFRVMHHGLIAHRHGVDLLVEAIALLRPEIPGIRLDIFGGRTPFLDDVLAKAASLGIAEIVRYHGSKSQVEIAAAIRRCHVGVVPNRRSVFTEINFPTRLFEYLALERPVIAPNTRGIRDYFGLDEILTFEPGDVKDLAGKIASLHGQPARAREFVARGIAVYRQHLWREQETQLIDSVAKLLPPRANHAG